MEKNNNSNKINGFNIFIIGIISFLYILLITKFAEIVSSQYYDQLIDIDVDMEANKISLYVWIIYFISIIGIVFGYVWLSNNNDTNTPNWILRWSLSVGGVLMLIYAITNYWDYLNDYCKLLLIFLSISSIIYYLYKYY